MSSSSESHVDVAAPIPTPSARHFSWYACTLAIKNARSLISRDPHTADTITSLSMHYSRAEIHSLSADFIFLPTTLGIVGVLYCAWTHGNRTPTNTTEIMELPNSHAFSFGGVDSLSPTTNFPCNFAVNFASRLVKPAPVEGARSRLVWLFEANKVVNGSASAFDAKTDGDTHIIKVYVKGKVSFSGAE